MSQDASTRLELLVPWDLPIEQPLNAVDRVRVGRALQQLLQALQQPTLQTALEQVEQAIAELGRVETELAQVHFTKTPLKQPQIEDFDDYFEAVHVQSADPAGCIVRSILVAYQRLLELWQEDDRDDLIERKFDPTQMEQQKQGLMSYAYLLARVFDLNL
ncbi:MAG: hypothetical protein HC769_29540 [Cyanobacteria bacterium CRU_2_1]|nr:hypothetical protein [Cyanobacteria bacterium CRU_2_1]